ncbi:hypothetical protein AGMMS50230_21300 [Spirochaetia bacterium]|nr:hypothetical protein AGMMS50230_21300 [Spirochaetia bacterium]
MVNSPWQEWHGAAIPLSDKDGRRPAGTRQSNISRLESGNYNPSFDFLNKIAMGKELEVRIV